MNAELVYTSDTEPGFTRRRAGRGFTYLDVEGNRIGDEEILQRIRNLAVPPAYNDVWICRRQNGHLQATGRDAALRKQYRYHTDWQRMRNQVKFHRMIDFAEALPTIRRQVQRDLDRDGLPKEKVAAAAVRAIDCSGARVGNDIYTKENGTHGMTTLRERHIKELDSGKIAFSYTGKHGKRVEFTLSSPTLAKLANRCHDLPGNELFQYRGCDGEWYSLDSADVNEYIHKVSSDFTAKDFRTWKASVHCFAILSRQIPAESEAARKREVNAAISEVAGSLFNRPATCRKHYIHPDIPEAFMERRTMDGAERFSRYRSPKSNLSSMEKSLLDFLS